MHRIIFTVLALILSTGIWVQGQELSRKEKKQIRKEQQEAELEQKAALTALMVEHHMFVLEADRLRDKRGNTVNVPSNLNFIASDSVVGVIQIGSHQYVGSNGVGGITVEGQIANYEFTHNEKNGTYNISYNVRSSVGYYDVRISVFRDGRADATVSSNWPGRVNYQGYLVPPSESRVWQGTSIY